MISKQYFEEAFSLATAQALQTWADENLITPTLGDYAMSINYAVNGGALLMYAETELTGLIVDDTYTVRMYINNITSNAFRIFINALPNDNSSAILQEGWISTPAWKEFSFVATATTMYLAIGDDSPAPTTTSTVDNVTVKDGGGTNYVTNSTFEGNDTTGWYGQSVNTELSIYQYAVAPTPPGDNPYLEPVNIPTYDEGNTEHFLISTLADWDHINDADKINFYVEPGDYSANSHMNITISGTASKRRTISLYNGNDTHPGKLADNERAFYSVKLYGSSYWTIDRPSWTTNGHRAYTFEDGSTYNILNRSYSSNTGNVVFVSHLSHYNTIQHGRFDTMPTNHRANDIMCILIQHNTNGYREDHVDIFGTKIIMNEAINQNDFVHVARTWSDTVTDTRQSGNMQDTVMDSNTIYITDDTITDVENAIDVKIGSADETKPMIISNNVMWGYAWHESEATLIFHYNPRNVLVQDNISFNSKESINTGSTSDAVIGESSAKGLMYSTVSGNLAYNCGRETTIYGIVQNSTVSTSYENNAIIDCVQGYLEAGNNDTDSRFQNNDICGTPDVWWDRGSNQSGWTDSLTTNNHFATAADGGYTEDIIIDYDIYTNSPQQITLTNAKKPV